MMDSIIEQQILFELRKLDAFSRRELLDFLQFLQYRKQSIAETTATIPPLRGKYKNRLSSTHEFARRKQDEIELENAKWTQQ